MIVIFFFFIQENYISINERESLMMGNASWTNGKDVEIPEGFS